MPFNHQAHNARFLAKPDPHGAKAYGVTITPAAVAKGETYWRVIGVHHLLPEENMSNRNVFMDVLDEKGNRLKNPIIWAGWTWEGIQGHERADPTPLDKPDNETAGNISVGGNQRVAVWVKGRSRASNDPSDRVEGLHTLHPDERLPDGRLLNSIGHHSFYVVFQRTIAGATPPPIVTLPPVEEPAPAPGVAYTHAAATFYLISAGGVRIGQVTTLEWARRIVAGLALLEASERDHRAESYVEGLRGLVGDE